ncbi:ABC transporter permease subunit [Mesorhizobium sp. M1136]|uniref:ABC transporter permease subunit n=1 Tax=Mesorhizobium sp. M1136 TaxID=2957059 RepID=UPI0033383983
MDPGQREAGKSIGMSRAMVLKRVTLPQALRIAVPTVGGYFIALLKDSSLVSFICKRDFPCTLTPALSTDGLRIGNGIWSDQTAVALAKLKGSRS